LVNEPEKTKKYLVLPLVPDLTYDLEKVFKKYDIQVAYESSGKLGDLLGNCKDKTPKLHKSGIYIIYCKMCQAYYMGQSKRRVGKRRKDHLGYIKASQLGKSGIADHCLMEGHKIGETKLLREIAQPYKLDAAESAFIVSHRHDINCVNTSAPPIQAPLFELIQLKYIFPVNFLLSTNHCIAFEIYISMPRNRKFSSEPKMG
jgi:hypothetical protein